MGLYQPVGIIALSLQMSTIIPRYGVATMGRLLENIGLFCKRAL